MSEEEKEVLVLLMEVNNYGRWTEVPSHRVADKKKVVKEVRLMNEGMHNLLWQ